MKVRWTPYLTGLLFLCSLCLRTGVAQAGFGDAPLVFLHVTVINPGNSSVEPDRAVTIDGDHITAVSSANFQSPSDAQTIDGTGQFLIPGTWDNACSRGFWGLVPGRPRYHPASLRG
jgi:hypothetical protein